MMLEIGIAFLKLNFLERRIDGAKIIQEVIKHANMLSFTGINENQIGGTIKKEQQAFVEGIISRLNEAQVLHQTFSKDRGHLQLVQRSEEMLKLLLSHNSVTEEDLNLIWSATRMDETTQLEIYKVFAELGSRLRENEVSFVVWQIAQMPLSKINGEAIELVNEFAKRG